MLIQRLGIFITVYTYHSMISFINLTWLLLTFILPTRKIFLFAQYIMLPYLMFEYSMLYLSNIVCANSSITPIRLIPFYYYALEVPQLELLLLFGILISFAVTPAIRRALLKDKEYLRNKIFEKVEDKNSSILWKFLYYIMQMIHLIILLLLLFYGTEENF